MPATSDRMHQRVTWEPMTEATIIRASIGGYPILPVGESWPVCAEGGCNRRMALFLQFDVEDRFGLPFETGSTLGIFQCIEHDDPFESLDAMSPKSHERLPEKYWRHANYSIFFTTPGNERQLREREPLVEYARLMFTAEREPHPQSVEALNYNAVKVGGAPFWIQQPKRWICSCGAAMDFLCSVPTSLEFPRAAA